MEAIVESVKEAHTLRPWVDFSVKIDMERVPCQACYTKSLFELCLQCMGSGHIVEKLEEA